MGSHAVRGAESTKSLNKKNTEQELGALVQLKGLAPLRYHAGVAIDGCPSFVADKQQKSALVSAIPTRSSPLFGEKYKKNGLCHIDIAIFWCS